MNLDLDIDGGFKEAVLSVGDLDLWRSLCTEAFGWNEGYQGHCEPASSGSEA